MSEKDLLRIVVDFRSAETTLRCLYRSENGPNPGTKARSREVSGLVRDGLKDALASLQTGHAVVVGTSGFDQREDTLLVGAKQA